MIHVACKEETRIEHKNQISQAQGWRQLGTSTNRRLRNSLFNDTASTEEVILHILSHFVILKYSGKKQLAFTWTDNHTHLSNDSQCPSWDTNCEEALHLEPNCPLHRQDWDDSIKTEQRETGCEDSNLIHVNKNRVKSRMFNPGNSVVVAAFRVSYIN